MSTSSPEGVPHDQNEIENLYKVASGVMVGHVFDNPQHVPIIVYQGPGDSVDDVDISKAEREFAFYFETSFVYIGELDPIEALRKARVMALQNCLAGRWL